MPILQFLQASSTVGSVSEVPINSHAAMPVESKIRQVARIRGGNPDWKKPGLRGINKRTKKERENRKLFKEVLNDIFTADPKRLRKLALRAIEFAEKGHAQFLTLILDRLDGPVLKELAPGSVTNNMFFSDNERQRALSEIEFIKNLKVVTVSPALPPIEETTDGNESTRTEAT